MIPEELFKELLPNDYYRNIFIPVFSRLIDEVWESTKKPANKDCVWEEYCGVFDFIIALRRQFYDDKTTSKRDSKRPT